MVCVRSVFGHISYRSDWELVKVDFRQSFPRQCTESDYDSWQLTDLQVTHTHKAVLTHMLTVHVCLYLELNSRFSVVTLRERSALWARSGVSGKGRTQRSVSKEKATPQLSPPNPVNAASKTSTGEHL